MLRTAVLAFAPLCLLAQDAPSRDDVLAAMRKSTTFFTEKVSTQGGYHFYYLEDLSWGRSEHGEGLTQIELQREGTPRVAIAYLEAYELTKDRSYLEAARRAAHATMSGQLCSGGFDYLVEFDPPKRAQYAYRADTGCKDGVKGRRPTTLDDNVTQAAVRVLMRVDRELGFEDEKLHEAALIALESLLRAQYPNGAWPQRYSAYPDPEKFPVKAASYPESWARKWPGENYQSHYTFNDGSISDLIDMMLEAARIYGDDRYLESAKKGGEFILLAQMPDPQPAWAQQYNVNMHPAWARKFEPPSITGSESQGVMRTLLVLYRETADRRYLDAVPRALQYLEKSVLPPVENPSEARRKFKAGEPVLARFYELETNQPLYFNLDYEMTYSDESVITHYALLISGSGLPGIRREYDTLAKADPQEMRRADRLQGLSPWAGQSKPRPPSASQVRAMIDAMDERGAWVENGEGGRIIRSTTFAQNLEALARYAASRVE